MATKKKQTTKPNKPAPVKTKALTRMNRVELIEVAKSLNMNVNHASYKSNAGLIKGIQKKRAAAKPAKKTEKKNGRKVDWSKAYEWYIEDHTRSYADVAKQFGVTKKSVEKAAVYTYSDGDKKGSWVTWSERRQELGEIARKKAEEDYKKTAPVRSQQHLLQYRNLQVAVSQKITALAAQGDVLVNPTTGAKVKVQEFDARQLADVAKALKLAIDGERVIMGLPTSVSTIKPGADDETGKGWGELLALAMKQASDENGKS